MRDLAPDMHRAQHQTPGFNMAMMRSLGQVNASGKRLGGGDLGIKREPAKERARATSIAFAHITPGRTTCRGVLRSQTQK